MVRKKKYSIYLVESLKYETENAFESWPILLELAVAEAT